MSAAQTGAVTNNNTLMEEKMNNQERIEFMIKITDIIFQIKERRLNPTTCTIQTKWGNFTGRTFSNGTLIGFDIDLNDDGIIVPLRILEQNPNKIDRYGNLKQNAILARAGHKIAWIIRRDKQQGFIGKVQDGVFEKSEPRALQTVTYGAAGTGTYQPTVGEDQFNQEYTGFDNGDWQASLPEINPSEIPLSVTDIDLNSMSMDMNDMTMALYSDPEIPF